MLSIVITSYDPQRKQDISDLLDSVQNQVCNDLEVVYVTERSTSLRDYVKEAIRSRGIRGKVIHNTGEWGLSECRNIGIKNSEGEIIAFIDDDVILDPKWSCAVINAFESFDDMIGATGPAYPYWVDERADWLPLELDWLIGCTRWFRSDVPVEVRNCWGMNMVFRREAFDIAGDFDTNATEKSRYLRSSTDNERGETMKQGKMAEDVEFSLRVKRLSGKKLLYLPDMRVLNKVYSYRLSKRFIIARSSWIGYSRRNIAKIGRGKQLATENLILISLLRTLFQVNRYAYRGNFFRRISTILLSTFSLALGYIFGMLA